MQFDAGTAAYKMGEYSKAIESFSQALLSKETSMQENSHFNMGRTLEERADMDKTDQDAIRDLENAQTHYEDVLKLNPKQRDARANLEAVKKKIERLKKPKPTPTPRPHLHFNSRRKREKTRGWSRLRLLEPLNLFLHCFQIGPCNLVVWVELEDVFIMSLCVL